MAFSVFLLCPPYSLLTQHSIAPWMRIRRVHDPIVHSWLDAIRAADGASHGAGHHVFYCTECKNVHCSYGAVHSPCVAAFCSVHKSPQGCAELFSYTGPLTRSSGLCLMANTLSCMLQRMAAARGLRLTADCLVCTTWPLAMCYDAGSSMSIKRQRLHTEVSLCKGDTSSAATARAPRQPPFDPREQHPYNCRSDEITKMQIICVVPICPGDYNSKWNDISQIFHHHLVPRAQRPYRTAIDHCSGTKAA